MLGLVCAYCAHKLVDGAAHCLHCGAPAHAKEHQREQPPSKPPQEQESSKPPPPEAESESSWVYWLVIGLLGFMAVVTVILVGRMMFRPAPATDPVAALPAQLRSAATCTVPDPARADCVIASADPLLREGLTAGRDLSFTATLVPQQQLAAVVDQWRRQGGKIISAGTVFVDISPSAGVRYANLATGLRIETVTFTSDSGARTFVMRTGLARQQL